MTASSTSPTASCDALLLRPQRDGGRSGDPPWEGPWRNPKPGSPTPPSHPPRGMEGKKYKGSCGNRRACRGGWGEPAVGSRLTGASLPPPQLCQYYHLMSLMICLRVSLSSLSWSISPTFKGSFFVPYIGTASAAIHVWLPIFICIGCD